MSENYYRADVIADSGDQRIAVSKQRAVVNILLVYVLLFVSGTWRYNLSDDKFLLLAFIVASLSWLRFSDRKINVGFILYLVAFSAILFSLSLYTGGSLAFVSVISAMMKLLLAYFLIKTVGERFIDTYLTVIVFLAAFSLFGYTVDSFHLFDGIIRKLPRVGDMGYEGIFYLYRFPWHMDRNNSIFFEPGAYQGFLNAALFILFFVKTGFSSRRIWVYVLILITALVTAFSTSGFLIFGVLFAAFLVRSELLSFAGKTVMAAVIAIVISLLATQFYSTVVVKVNDYLTADEFESTVSAKNRSADAKTDFKVFKKNIFGTGHEKYMKAFGSAGRVDVERDASSNGVTKMLAVYGLPFSLFMFCSYFWALKKLLGDLLLTIVAYVMFMMFLATESYYMASPICYSIIVSAFIYRRMSTQENVQTV